MKYLKSIALEEIRNLALIYDENYQKFSGDFQIKFKNMLYTLLQFIRRCSLDDENLIDQIIYIKEQKLFLEDNKNHCV